MAHPTPVDNPPPVDKRLGGSQLANSARGGHPSAKN